MHDKLIRFAQQLEDQHAPQHMTVLMREAAKEMDRLRAALREYVCDCKGGCDADASFNIHWKCGNTAPAALENSNG